MFVEKGNLHWLVLVATVLTLGSGAADDGRDFAGLYEVTNVTDMVSEVGLTLTLEVCNYSGADIYDGTITLRDSNFPEETYGSFFAVHLVERESTSLRGDFVVPKSEYELWEQGGTPELWIDFQNAAGDNLQHWIELAPSVVGEEE